MPQWLLILLVALATYRITRLLTVDAFPPIDRLRFKIGRRFGHDGWQAYLATCSWCTSVWIGAAVVALADHFTRGGVAAPLLVWPAASGMTGYLAALEPD